MVDILDVNDDVNAFILERIKQANVSSKVNVDEEHSQNDNLNMKIWDYYSVNDADKSEFRKYYQREQIKSFDLKLCGELDKKMKHIIENFEKWEKIKALDVVENVMIFGITRCYHMSYSQAKTYLFMQSEVFRNIDIFCDEICYADEKSADSSGSAIKYKNIIIKKDDYNDYEQINITKNFEIDDEINSFNITLTGDLRRLFVDLAAIWLQKYNFSSVKSLEYAIQVGINSVYDMTNDACDFCDLSDDVYIFSL